MRFAIATRSFTLAGRRTTTSARSARAEQKRLLAGVVVGVLAFVFVATAGAAAKHPHMQLASGKPPPNNFDFSAAARLRTLQSTVTGTITPGGAAVTMTIATAGDTGQLTFSGTIGQRVSLNITNVSISLSTVAIQNPDGTPLYSTTVFSSGKFIDTQPLAQTGTYSILIQPWSGGTGSMTLQLYDVPADQAGPIVPTGDDVSVSVASPGQNASFTFDGNAGERVFVSSIGSTITSNIVAINKPDGIRLASTGAIGPGDHFIDTQVLPSDGAYTVVVDPLDTATGSLTLTLFSVPDDNYGSMGVGERPIDAAPATPGQNPTFDFAGTAGQAIVGAISAGIPFSTGRILNPDGTTLTSSMIGSGGGALGPLTLPTTGTYEFVVDPWLNYMGSVQLSLTAQNAPQNTQQPQIGGSATADSVLTSDDGAWSGATTGFTYQWQTCPLANLCEDIPDATGATYTLTDDEVDTTTRVLVGTANASGSAVVRSGQTATVSGTKRAPKATYSYYVSNTNAARWYDLGCTLGNGITANQYAKRAAVILSFGDPTTLPDGHTAATITFDRVTTPLAQSEAAAEQYGAGFYQCAPRGADLQLIYGTTNHGGVATFAHGVAWARAVTAIENYFVSHGYGAKVFALGGFDAELGWATPTDTRAWVRGYLSAFRYPYVDFGDAAGCPNCSGQGTWHQSDVYWISWAAVAAFPFPQDYNTLGNQAAQWHALSKYGVGKPTGKMYFPGTLSQHQACLDTSPCPGIDNTPDDAWAYLYNALNGDPATRVAVPRVSDIRWQN